MTDPAPIPKEKGICEFCGEPGAVPVDVVVARELLGPDAIGQAHSKCFIEAREIANP